MTGSTRFFRDRQGALEASILGGLSLFYLLTTVPNIGNHPIVGGDEGWIISASAKLAEDGVFGSDLFTGFFGAERHYYFNLPLHHLVLAGVFKVVDAGLAQARLTSAFFGLVTLALTWMLGRRLGGRWAGIGAAALLVLLRLNLTPFTGLTLTDLGATVRYDLVAAPFALGATLLLLRSPSPAPKDATIAGLVLGLGCLTQFVDAFLVAPMALFLLTLALPWRARMLNLAVFGLALLAPLLPYAAYIAMDWEDFEGQSRSVEQRTDLLSPGFYLDNLSGEPDRYGLALDLDTPSTLSELVQRPSARLVLLVLAPLALAFTVWRAEKGSAAHRLLAYILIALVVEFALFESTKRFVYWVIAVPFLCVALADAAVALGGWRPERRLLRQGALVALVAIAALIALEGLAVGVRNVADARDAGDYSDAGQAVREVIPPGSTVLTDNRMFMALPDMRPRSLHLLFYWTNTRIAGDQVTDIDGAMRRIGAAYFLSSPLTKEHLGRLSPEDRTRFAIYLDQHARHIATVSRPPYGPIDVYELR